MSQMVVFGLEGSKKFARRVAMNLDIPLAKHQEKRFSDGESYIRSGVNVRGQDVYVIHSLYSDHDQTVADKLTNLLFFLGSLNDASAGRITVVVPHLAYARQDRKTESRAPITTKYIAKLIETAGADRLLTMDVHNLSAFQNSFRIPTDNLEAKNLMVDFLLGSDRHGNEVDWAISDQPDFENLVVLSPDAGGMGRVRRFRTALEERLGLKNKINLAYLDKERITNSSGDGHEMESDADGDKIVGDVKDKDVLILDDMISSGKTIQVSADAVEAHGGRLWGVFATHGLFVGKASEYLANVKRVIVTDTIPPFRIKSPALHVIPTARMFAQAIRRTHEDGGSISELLQA